MNLLFFLAGIYLCLWFGWWMSTLEHPRETGFHEDMKKHWGEFKSWFGKWW